jgi:hypothetical protein
MSKGVALETLSFYEFSPIGDPAPVARPRKEELPWFSKVCDLMVRNGVSLKEAAQDLELPLTTEELINIQRLRAFQSALWTARHRLNKELATDPGFTKESVIGEFLALGKMLREEGAYDKAAEVLFKLCKVMNWIGIEGQVNVFAGLSQKEYDILRGQLERAVGESTTRAN